MLTLLFFITSIIASVIAVKFTAKSLKSTKHDWLSSVITVVLSLVVITAVSSLIPWWYAAIPVAIVVVGFVIESTLDTTLQKGIIIAAIAILVQWLIKFGFMFAGVNTDFLVLIQQILQAK